MHELSGRRVLVTGASGFVGRHLMGAAAFAGVEFATLQNVDIRDRSALQAEVASIRPDHVIHLAAQSFVPRSFEDPAGTLEINLMGTLHLLQALDSVGFSGRLLYVSSGDVYGAVHESQLPVTEQHPPAPRNPYAVSKLSAELLCLQWHRSNSLDVVVARPFNHVGPGQDAAFVVPALAAQVVAIARGQRAPVIRAGDIDVTRDFTDVRDIVAGYARLLVSGTSGRTYQLCSGVERSVRGILERLLALKAVDAEIEQDPSKFRPAEQRRMVADNTWVSRDTGWLPAIPWEKTLQDIIEEMESRT
ncbi:GDP-mannose 4,6-dehydratase [Stenotrophomonas acidaminiphila]|uniref:GDP-mannose 4,6-dehydratase n=1 Tax=Stenotrophomonas acidaminiphila TaxID=128780 RepID=UPI0028AD24CF|nr:GDP-mannose 4,6-dehydratase [Stenotrophomonas acidaminiphila]